MHTDVGSILLGVTRKLLNLTFQGETRYADGMIWGDVEINGLTNDVKPFIYFSYQSDALSALVLAYLGQTWAFHVGSPDINCNKPSLTRICSIMARPLSSTDNKFGIGITGQNFDPTDLAEPAKVKHFIHAETGRTDLEFGDFSWLSYFK